MGDHYNIDRGPSGCGEMLLGFQTIKLTSTDTRKDEKEQEASAALYSPAKTI